MLWAPAAACEEKTNADLPPERDEARLALSDAFPKLSFDRPVDLAALPNDPRLFVVEQKGKIWSFVPKSEPTERKLVLDVSQLTRAYDDLGGNQEEGLLGLALHPQFSKNRWLYINHTIRDPKSRRALTVVARYHLPKDVVDPGSRSEVIRIAQPYGNHNGGQIMFGPDGFLYIGMGDGGKANDPHGHGQNLGTLLGALLRIDVSHPTKDSPYTIPKDNPFVGKPGARGEIFAYGLRTHGVFLLIALPASCGWLTWAKTGLRKSISFPKARTTAGISWKAIIASSPR